MNSLRIAASSAAFSLVIIAQASEPPCWLRTAGTTKATAAGVANPQTTDSGQVPNVETLPLNQSANQSISGNIAFVTNSGEAKFGKLTQNTFANLEGNANAMVNTSIGSNQLADGNLCFKDQIQFWNPNISFGTPMTWRFDLNLMSLLTGAVGSQYANASRASLELEGFASLTVYSVQGQAAKLNDTLTVVIPNGDSLYFKGCLSHDLNINASPLAKRVVNLDSVATSFITPITAGGQYIACGKYQAVPEPGTMLALSVGAALLIRKRRKA